MPRRDLTGLPAATRTAAFFDFDGTIIAGYSILAFLKERVRRGELGAADIARTAVSLAQSALGQIDSRDLIARGMHEWSCLLYTSPSPRD